METVCVKLVKKFAENLTGGLSLFSSVSLWTGGNVHSVFLFQINECWINFKVLRCYFSSWDYKRSCWALYWIFSHAHPKFTHIYGHETLKASRFNFHKPINVRAWWHQSDFVHFDKRQVTSTLYIPSELCARQCFTLVDEDLTIVKVWTLGDQGQWCKKTYCG